MIKPVAHGMASNRAVQSHDQQWAYQNHVKKIGTVKSRIRRGMIKLRKKLRDPANKPSP